MQNLPHPFSSHIYLHRFEQFRHLKLLAAAAATLLGACVTEPETSEVASAGMLNGMLNGLYHTEGLTQYLSAQCPLLQQRLMVNGDLTQPFPSSFSTEIGKPVCEKFMFYTVELMVPQGQQINLFVGTKQVASFAGVMGMQYLVRQVYPQYTFAQHAFLPTYPIARKVVTQGYAALTNDITRRVSYRTNIMAMDASRLPEEDSWPREFLQLVPFSLDGLAAMATNPAFLAQQPDFFNVCDPHLINYNHLRTDGPYPPPQGACPIPVVVHGNLSFTNDIVPGRSCRILEPGETPPSGTFLSGDVIVPEGGCPLIYYAGRVPGSIIYDDRTKNPLPTQTSDGCDVTGPSKLTNCRFSVVPTGATPIPSQYLSYYVFNVEPI
jgi:hypothetical protein